MTSAAHDDELTTWQQPMHFLGPFLSHNGITSAAHDERRNLYVRKVLFHVIRKSVLKRAKRTSGATRSTRSQKKSAA